MIPRISYDLCSARHCNICFLNLSEDKNLTSKLRRCNNCRLVLYCGPKHQKLDWPLHRELCRAATKILRRYSVDNLYTFNGQPTTQEEMELAILKAKFLLRNVLNRPLHYFEEELTSFPVYCRICFSFNNLKICRNCEAISYCSEKHAMEDKDRHIQECGFLKLYNCIYKLEKLPTDVVTIFEECVPDLQKWDLIEMFERLTKLKLPSNPTNSLKDYNFFATCSDFSCISTICYSLTFVEMRNYTNEKFVIFIVGATVEEEWFADIHTKLFFLLYPQIENLHLYFIGPEVIGPSSKTSNYNLKGKGRTVNYFSYRGLFQTFCYECPAKPSIIISFNCGFSEFSNYDIHSDTDIDTFPVGPNKHDKWFKGLSEMLQTYQIPIFFTSFTKLEADLDFGALLRVAEMEDIPVRIEHIFSVQRNPFRDLRPLRNWHFREKEDIFFRNGYIQGVRSKLKQ